MAVTGRIAPGQIANAARRSGLPWGFVSGGLNPPQTPIATPVSGVPQPVPSPEGETIAIVPPKIDTAFVNQNGSMAIPWYQMIINMCAYMQPSGIIAGTYGGVTFNSSGKATSAQSSGAEIHSPTLNDPIINDATINGATMTEATAETQPPGDNSTYVATTAFVQSEGFLKANQNITVSGDGSGSGSTAIALTVIGLRNHPINNVTPVQGQFLTFSGGAWTPGDAPNDGRFYARQSGAWVAITATPAP